MVLRRLPTSGSRRGTSKPTAEIQMVVDVKDLWITPSARRASDFEGAQGTLLDIDHGNYPYVIIVFRILPRWWGADGFRFRVRASSIMFWGSAKA
jgi:hypothetical protein